MYKHSLFLTLPRPINPSLTSHPHSIPYLLERRCIPCHHLISSLNPILGPSSEVSSVYIHFVSSDNIHGHWHSGIVLCNLYTVAHEILTSFNSVGTGERKMKWFAKAFLPVRRHSTWTWGVWHRIPQGEVGMQSSWGLGGAGRRISCNTALRTPPRTQGSSCWFGFTSHL